MTKTLTKVHVQIEWRGIRTLKTSVTKISYYNLSSFEH